MLPICVLASMRRRRSRSPQEPFRQRYSSRGQPQGDGRARIKCIHHHLRLVKLEKHSAIPSAVPPSARFVSPEAARSVAKKVGETAGHALNISCQIARSWREISVAFAICVVVALSIRGGDVILRTDAGVALSMASEEALEAHRWDCVAVVLDYVFDAPYAWGIASALRLLPALWSSLLATPSLAAVARWAARSSADGLFVPVEECLPFFDENLTAILWPGIEDATACGRGLVYCVLAGPRPFLALYRYELAMVVDETIAITAGLAFATVRGPNFLRNYFALFAVKVAGIRVPRDRNHGYFVSQLLGLGAMLAGIP